MSDEAGAEKDHLRCLLLDELARSLYDACRSAGEPWTDETWLAVARRAVKEIAALASSSGIEITEGPGPVLVVNSAALDTFEELQKTRRQRDALAAELKIWGIAAEPILEGA